MTNARIDLAHEAAFALGPVHVLPATREIVRGETREIVEPRVMQVLVALHRAGGAVVSKSDLGESCWEGRVVGEDAINRVMSRLRKLTDGIAAGAFRVETVTRVGYRLIAGEDAGTATPATARTGSPAISRRSLLIASGSAVVVAGGGFAVWKATRYHPPREAIELVEAAGTAINYGTPEQIATAVSLLQQATRIAPDWGDAWGFLSLAYAQQAMLSPGRERATLLDRSKGAAARALTLDPDNIDAQVAGLVARRGSGNRVRGDAEQRRLLALAPDHPVVNAARAGFLAQVGRTREAVVHFERTIKAGMFNPPLGYSHALALVASGRLDEGDAAMERTFARWPRHYGVWFSRYKHFLYTDRVDAAVAMLANEGGRPSGIPASNFELCALECRAMAGRAPADMRRATEAHLAAARTGVGFAQNAMTFAAATGQIDTAYTLADAYFFDKGFQLPEQRFTREQGLYSASRSRPSYFLFDRNFAAMRADPRFVTITRGIGLEDYWRGVGVQPDYRA